mgnify:CR=1 FL=1
MILREFAQANSLFSFSKLIKIILFDILKKSPRKPLGKLLGMRKMKYLNIKSWKFMAGFLLILGLGIAALAISADYLERNQIAGESFNVR